MNVYSGYIGNHVGIVYKMYNLFMAHSALGVCNVYHTCKVYHVNIAISNDYMLDNAHKL